MATIDWKKVGEEARKLNYSDSQSDRYAQKINGGTPLTDNEKAQFAQGFIGRGAGSGNSGNDKYEFGKTAGRAAGTFTENLAASQNLPSTVSLVENEKLEISNLVETIRGGLGGSLTSLLGDSLIKGLSFAGSQITDVLTNEVKLRNEVNAKLGMAGQLSRDYRDNIFEASPAVAGMGYSFEELATTTMRVSQDMGNMAMVGADIFEKGAVTSRAFIGNLQDLPQYLNNFNEIGIGAGDALEQINEAGKSSMALGLQSRKVVSDVNDNLSKINQYGFQNGVQGLTKMVQQAVQFKFNMQNTFDLAEKLFDPDQAIDLSANLQAIGGAIGDFNDPLKMMYNATNNVGGIQDALIGAASSLATYNQEQGRFEITGVNLRRAKAMADQFGMSLEKLSTTAIKAGERQSASTALMSRGLSLDDKEKEFLTNISRMEGGKMVIDVSSISKEFGGAQRIALDTLTEVQKDALLKNQKAFEEMSPEQIAKEQFTQTQNMALNVAEILGILRVRFAREARVAGAAIDEGTKGVSDYLSKTAKEMNASSKSGAKNENIDLADNAIRTASGLLMATPSTPQQSVPVNNSTQQPQTNTTTTQNNQPNKTEVTLNVKSDPIMDEFSRYIVRRPETIDAFLNSSSPRDYTSQ
jgi:hypothetical protein